MTVDVTLYTHRRFAAGATGIGRYVRELTAALARQRTSERLRVASAEPVFRFDADALPEIELPIDPTRVHSLWTMASRPHLDRWIGSTDLVHVLYPSTPVPTSAPMAWTIHDLMPMIHPEFPRRERWAFRRAIRQAIDGGHHLIANSEKTRSELLDHTTADPRSISVVHLGVSAAFGTLSAQERNDHRPTGPIDAMSGLADQPYAVVVGAVSDRKNLAVLIRALEQGGPEDLTIIAIGPPGAGFERIETLVSERRMTTRVRFSGWLEQDQVTKLVRGARMLLHPSHDEGFGMPPLEAMVAGVPTIVSDAGSLPEVCGDASLYAAPDDPEAWASAMRRLSEDEDLRTELIAAGVRWSAGFTWDRTASETVAIYRSLVAR